MTAENLKLANLQAPEPEKETQNYNMQIFFPWNHIYLAVDGQGEKVLFLPAPL